MGADANDVASMLQARAAGMSPDTDDIGEMLKARAAQPASAPKKAAPLVPLSRTSRAATGLGDLEVGLGQVAEHVAETPLNWLRKGIFSPIAKGAGAVATAAGFPKFGSDIEGAVNEESTTDFDRIVRQREQDYQASRQAAGQTGIDWWRLAGEAANPVNYLSGGTAAETALGRIGQGALQGGALGATQPSTTPGNFWWDKAKQMGGGALAGGLVSGLIETVTPLIRAGVSALRRAVPGAADTGAAEAIVNDALTAKGVDPATVNLNVVGGLKQEAQDVLDMGGEVSPEMVAMRAKAESLPVPMRLMKPQLTGDATQFSKMKNLAKLEGVGDPIQANLVAQNQAAIQNLDALGAKNAPDVIDTGNALAERVQGYWNALQKQKSDLYASVRNSQGQSAAMDGFTVAQNIRDRLDSPEASHAWSYLEKSAPHITQTIDDLMDGKMPLTVASMQNLDKVWGSAAATSDGTLRHAIGIAREELNNAPVSDEVGEEARQAYMAARAAHAQQMALVEPKLLNGMPNPNFQPLVKAVVMDGKPPEGLFQTHFMGAAPSVSSKNLAFMNQLDPSMPQQIGTTLMGEIKRQALNAASDERGTVSNAVLSGWANNPVQSAKLDALLPQGNAQTFRNLADVVEAAKRFPAEHGVNTSNTGSALINAGKAVIQNNVAGQVIKRLPIIKDIAQGRAAAAEQTAVGEMIRPGVSLKSLLGATPAQATARRFGAQLAIPAAIAASRGSNNDQQ